MIMVDELRLVYKLGNLLREAVNHEDVQIGFEIDSRRMLKITFRVFTHTRTLTHSLAINEEYLTNMQFDPNSLLSETIVELNKQLMQGPLTWK